MMLMILTKLFEAVKAAGRWAVQRPKDAAILVLVMFLALMFWCLNRERKKSRELTAKIAGLPPNVQQVVTVYRDRIITKWRDGATKIEYRDRYLPPEGKVEMVTKSNAPTAPPEILIHDHGFTHRIGGGIVYAAEPLPLLDLKWAYWRRYSTTIGITPLFGGFGISRHIDDFVPFDNLEIVGMAGVGWHGEGRLAIGLRTNF